MNSQSLQLCRTIYLLRSVHLYNGLVYRDWAIYYALKGDKATALSNLEKAIELGYNNLTKISREEAFEILHQETRYQVLIQQLQNNDDK